MPDVSTTTARRSNLLVLLALLLVVAAVRLVLGRTVGGDGEVGVRLGIPAGLILELRLSTGRRPRLRARPSGSPGWDSGPAPECAGQPLVLGVSSAPASG